MRYLQLTLALCLLLAAPLSAGAQTPTAAAASHMVNVPVLADPVDWNRSAIFWFGRLDWNPGPPRAAPVPGRNHVDVRVAATPQALVVFATVVDYHLWQATNPQPGDDLTQYDGIALMIDTRGDRSGAPQPDDYRFFTGWRGGDANNPPFQRQARGTGGGWDAGWTGAWRDKPGSQWSTGGPNNNGGEIDYGWANTFTIPWSTLGYQGAPAAGTVMGLAVELFDRDDAAGATSPVQRWPDGASPQAPSSWGGLRIGARPDLSPLTRVEGQTTIRRGLPGSTVEDVTVGADGNCIGGHEGDPEGFNQAGQEHLFVASQTAPTDFPCFARTYLRFGLNTVPPGKSIVRAELTMHLFGNAGFTSEDPKPSLIQLSTTGDWSEASATWNRSPLARENLSSTWVNPVRPGAPGANYTWDATLAVREAYEAGRPVNLVLYMPDSEMHSSKYFYSSDLPDWGQDVRPSLVITWGTPTDASRLVNMFLPQVRAGS